MLNYIIDMIVIVGLLFLLFSVLIEALIYLDKSVWHGRRLASILSALFLLLAGTLVVLPGDNGWLLLVAIVGLYKLVNLGRLHKSRLPDKHLYNLAVRTFIILTLLQVFIVFGWQISLLIDSWNITATDLLNILIIASFICSVVVLISTVAKLFKSSPVKTIPLSHSELPTLTVAIAARNESPNLTACLESIINDNYPKLEILVLDDGSHDKTAEIIKSFANSGVRFVKHQKFNGDWLAKNNAYQTLLSQASGQLIVFMGVDTRLHENSLKGLVEQFVAKEVDMLCVIPKRTKSGLLAAFLQPMRYWWELALPRTVLKRPPALSTVWLVDTAKLNAIGGFNTYKRSITPEEHLAKLFSNVGRYALVRPASSMLITTHKDFFRQWDTAVRTRYPHAHRRPETVLFQVALMFWLFILPFILLPFVIFSDSFSLPYALLVLATAVNYMVGHVMISIVTNPTAAYLAPINFPVAVALDIYAMHVSMLRYEFGKVIWKGRDVAPVKLKAIAHLPELPEKI